MTVSFFKLHVAGDDFILVDRAKDGHQAFRDRADELPGLAAALADRRRGVGGSGVVFVGPPETLSARAFDPEGNEREPSADALLCVARWAFDSGRAEAGKVRVRGLSGERTLSAIDSRSFALELPAAPLEEAARLELLLDGLGETAYILRWKGVWAATVGKEAGPTPKRVREALSSAVPEATPVVARPAGRDLVRFSTVDDADRSTAAAAAVAAGMLAGRTDDSAVAEWRGKGAAVSFADFGPAETPRSPGAVGPGELIDRGRFYVEWKRPDRVLVAGIAEYAFEGSFDWFPR